MPDIPPNAVNTPHIPYTDENIFPDDAEDSLYTQACNLAACVGNQLTEQKKTFSTAESCTGGLISAICTDVSGASGWLTGGIIAYSNKVKEQLLGVEQAILLTHGAVSEPVVLTMAVGARKALNTNCSVSVSGIAGPTGGTPEKPVGTVWIGCSVDKITMAEHHIFSGNRAQVRLKTVITALTMVNNYLNTTKKQRAL